MIRPGYIPPVRRPLAAIRRKFRPSPKFLALVGIANSNAPGAAAETPDLPPGLAHLSTTQFEDVYYDSPDRVLEEYGITLRRRSGAWQINRHPAAPSTLNPHVGTLHDVTAIVKVLERAAPGVQLYHGGVQGLKETARFLTVRDTWGADLDVENTGPIFQRMGSTTASRAGKEEAPSIPDACNIYHDAMDFGHALGEVRITVDLGYGDHGEWGDRVGGRRSSLVESQEARLEAFMMKHEALFNPHEEPVGKLVAYFVAKGKGGEVGAAKGVEPPKAGGDNPAVVA